ncbi:MAG TPA: hypothetical protein VHC22_17685 [Pirellulales bacterium]|nr:hypothetical protein [Pirellulales bacterium]
MSHAADANLDPIDFIYCPEQPPTDELRIEVLELQVADLRNQVDALLERLASAED